MPLSNLFEDDLLDAIFTNTPPRMRKATYSILSTPEDYERAQRRAQSHLPLAIGTACKEQVGYVGARDDQHQSNRAKQNEQHPTVTLHQCFS